MKSKVAKAIQGRSHIRWGNDNVREISDSDSGGSSDEAPPKWSPVKGRASTPIARHRSRHGRDVDGGDDRDNTAGKDTDGGATGHTPSAFRGVMSPESTVYLSRMAQPSVTSHWASHVTNMPLRNGFGSHGSSDQALTTFRAGTQSPTPGSSTITGGGVGTGNSGMRGAGAGEADLWRCAHSTTAVAGFVLLLLLLLSLLCITRQLTRCSYC